MKLRDVFRPGVFENLAQIVVRPEKEHLFARPRAYSLAD